MNSYLHFMYDRDEKFFKTVLFSNWTFSCHYKIMGAPVVHSVFEMNEWLGNINVAL